MTQLKDLPQVKLGASGTLARRGEEETARLILENTGGTLAFFVHLQIKQSASGREILPVIWQDNYFSLMPGERREVAATYRVKDLEGGTPVLAVEGWNVLPSSQPLGR
jgi:exo-1,4-beta-D-glucosaminidase